MRVDFARFFVSLPKEVVELAERESAFRDFGVKSVDAFDAIRQKLLDTVLAAGLSCNGEEVRCVRNYFDNNNNDD